MLEPWLWPMLICAVLVLLGITGGGLEIKGWVQVPKIGIAARVISVVCGLAFLLPYAVPSVRDDIDAVLNPRPAAPSPIPGSSSTNDTSPTVAAQIPSPVAAPAPATGASLSHSIPLNEKIPASHLITDSDVLLLKPGDYPLDSDPDVKIRIGSSVSTQCSGAKSSELEEYPIRDLNIDRPEYIYIVLHASNGIMDYNNKDIGYIRLEFKTKAPKIIPLKLGYNIRDVERVPQSPDNRSVTQIDPNSGVRQYRSATVPSGDIWGVDLMTIHLGEDEADSLVSIIITDTSNAENGGIHSPDPCIEIKAITVKQRS